VLIKAPDDRGPKSGATRWTYGYCFICGLAVLAGVIFEPLWLFADMYILLWCLVGA